MMGKLKIGFIGCGRHATKMIYPSLRYAPIVLEAVCDMDERLARRNARWFGASSYYTDYQLMLDECKLDAVMIVTGPTSHTKLAKEVLQRGLPAFIEKPPALNLAEAGAVAQASEACGLPVTVGLMKRQALAYQRVKSIIESEEFGLISHIQAKLCIGQKKGTGFALLLDAGIHILDLVRFLGGEVSKIHAEKWEGKSGVAYAIMLRFESGAVGNVHISDQGSWFASNEYVEVTGIGQLVQSENLLKVLHTNHDGQIHVWEPGFSIPQNQNNSLFLQGYAPQVQVWAQALLNNTEPMPTIGDTCHTMQLIKTLEPGEDYAKKPQRFSHWEAENTWLTLDD